MPTTIKGPIKIGGRDGKTPIDLVKAGIVRLPFVATGWKSTMNSNLVTGNPAQGPEEPVVAQTESKHKRKK